MKIIKQAAFVDALVAMETKEILRRFVKKFSFSCLCSYVSMRSVFN